MWGPPLKFTGLDELGLPTFEWCCDDARDKKDAISFLNDGNREYDNDRTGFYIVGKCVGDGKHTIHKILYCPFCAAPVE